MIFSNGFVFLFVLLVFGVLVVLLVVLGVLRVILLVFGVVPVQTHGIARPRTVVRIITAFCARCFDDILRF